MSFKHGKNTVVLLNGTDVSTYFRDTSLSTSVDVADTTTFSSSDKTYIPGLIDSTVSASGLYDGSVGAVDEIMVGALGGSSKAVLTVLRHGVQSGDPADVIYVDETSYELSSPVADVVTISANFQSSQPARGGLLLNSFVPVTASTTHASQDNTTSSTKGFIANLHVTANTRSGNTTVIVEQSSNGSSWTTLATFTVVAGGVTAAYRVSGSGTVERYVRARSTLAGSGSVTYAIAFARL